MKKTFIIFGLLATIYISPALAHDEMMIEQKAHWYFDRMDTNHDGMISPAEHAAFASRMFTDADTNHDGMLSYNEVLAAKKAEHERMMNMKPDDKMMPGDHLPNRVNTNPSDHSINKGGPDEPNSKYLNK